MCVCVCTYVSSQENNLVRLIRLCDKKSSTAHANKGGNKIWTIRRTRTCNTHTSPYLFTQSCGTDCTNWQLERTNRHCMCTNTARKAQYNGKGKDRCAASRQCELNLRQSTDSGSKLQPWSCNMLLHRRGEGNKCQCATVSCCVLICECLCMCLRLPVYVSANMCGSKQGCCALEGQTMLYKYNMPKGFTNTHTHIWYKQCFICIYICVRLHRWVCMYHMCIPYLCNKECYRSTNSAIVLIFFYCL